VTSDGEFVWDYINPPTKEYGILYFVPASYPVTSAVFRAYRYGPEHPDFADNDLTPKDTVTGLYKVRRHKNRVNRLNQNKTLSKYLKKTNLIRTCQEK
jgi:hypothetical protein